MKVIWTTAVKGDPMASISVATRARYREGHYSFHWIAPLILDPYLVMLSIKQGDIKYHFGVFGMTRD